MEPTADHQYDRLQAEPPEHEIMYLYTLYNGLCTVVRVEERVKKNDVLVYRVWFFVYEECNTANL